MEGMEKYRGPEKQYPKVERKYLVRLIIGLLIITAGVLSVNVNVALSRSTIMVPGADPGAGPEEIESGMVIGCQWVPKTDVLVDVEIGKEGDKRGMV